MTHEANSEDGKGVQSILTLLKEALPLIGLLLLPAFALRALITARFDLNVAIALVQFTPALSFLLASLLDILPLLMYALGLIVLFGTGMSYRGGSFAGPFPGMVAFLLALLMSVPIFMTAPYPEYPYYFFLLAPLTTTIQSGRSHLGNRNFRQLLSSMDFYLSGVIAVICIVGVSTFLKGIWLAPEILTIRDIPKTEYVLQQQDRDLIIYDPDLHAVIRVPTADVSHRQFCNIKSFTTLAERVFDGPQGRPPCPK